MWSAEEIECMIPRAGEFIGSVRYTFENRSFTEFSYFEYGGEYFKHVLSMDSEGNTLTEGYSQVEWDEIPMQLM